MRTLPNTVPAGKHESTLLSTIVIRDRVLGGEDGT